MSNLVKNALQLFATLGLIYLALQVPPVVAQHQVGGTDSYKPGTSANEHGAVSCLPSLPPAATFIMPQAGISAEAPFNIDIEPIESFSDFEIKISEHGKASNAPERLSVSQTIGQVTARSRHKVNITFPGGLIDRQAKVLLPRGRSSVPVRARIFKVEALGKTKEGKEAYSVDLFTFEETAPGIFVPVPLSTFLQKHGSEVGGLDQLQPEEIDTTPGQPSGAEPVEKVDRFMDAEGRVTIKTSDLGRTINSLQTTTGTLSTITATVSGYIYMMGSDGVARPAPSVEVAVWEDDGTSAYASYDNIVLTNSAGYFSTVVVHDDGDSSLELFLRVRSINSWVRMGNYWDNGEGVGKCSDKNNYCGLSSSNNVLEWTGPVATGITGGSVPMNYTVSDSRAGAVQIYAWLNEASALTRTSYNPGEARAVFGMPDPGAFSIPEYNYNLVFGYTNGSIGGEDAPYHEYGHLTMYRSNGYKNGNEGGPHSINGLYHPALAWSEGWSTGYAQHIRSDGYYNASNMPYPMPIEDARLEAYPINTTSAHNEMWVAAAMNDFYDYGEPVGGDDPADGVLSFPEEMEIIRATNIDSFIEFYNTLIASGMTTPMEEHYASRAARYNKFDCCISLIPAPQLLAAYITGPEFLGYKERGTWTAVASNGNGTYTYEWRYRWPGGAWSSVVSTTSTYSRAMLDSDFELQAKVMSGSEVTNATLYVESGPYMASYGKIDSEPVPTSFSLETAYPNPFRSSTRIQFAIPEAVHVHLSVYDVTGREVARIIDANLEAGYETATWSGEGMPSGLYFLRIQAGAFADTKTVTLVK